MPDKWYYIRLMCRVYPDSDPQVLFEAWERLDQESAGQVSSPRPEQMVCSSQSSLAVASQAHQSEARGSRTERKAGRDTRTSSPYKASATKAKARHIRPASTA